MVMDEGWAVSDGIHEGAFVGRLQGHLRSEGARASGK